MGFKIEDIQKLNDEDLSDLIDIAIAIYRNRRATRGQGLKLTMKVGTKVSFLHNGRKMMGEIHKKNPSRAKVHTAIGIFNCPYTLLTIEE